MSDENKVKMESNPELARQVSQSNATGYSAEYVKTLRDEAASWRTKLRETEGELNTLKETQQIAELDATIGVELKKRNIAVNPAWVDITEGQTVEQAVDTFVKKYPTVIPQETLTVESPQQRSTRKPMSTEKTNTNVQSAVVTDVGAIKRDPIARAKLRDHYRGLLGKVGS